MYLDAIFATRFAQAEQAAIDIGYISECRITVDSAFNDMMRLSCEYAARCSWHENGEGVRSSVNPRLTKCVTDRSQRASEECIEMRATLDLVL